LPNYENGKSQSVDLFGFMFDTKEKFGMIIRAVDDVVKDVSDLISWKNLTTAEHYITNVEFDKKIELVWRHINDNDKLTEKHEGRINTLMWILGIGFLAIVIQAIVFFWKFYPTLLELQKKVGG